MSGQAPNDGGWRALFPWNAKYHSIGLHRMHYVDEGRGRPVLMVHGNPTWTFYYRNVIRALQTDYRAIAIDHLGCGLSDQPDAPLRLKDHTDNLTDFIVSQDLSGIVLVAHDWGGAIGLGTVAREIGRFAGIVLLNTAAFPPPYIPFRIRVCRWPLIGKVAVQGLNTFARAATTMATSRRGGLPDEIADGLVSPYNSWQNRSAIYQFVRDIPLSPSHPTWSVLEALECSLSQLGDLPVQMIWGMKDWCFREECLERLQQSIPHAEVDRVKEAGHYVLEDAPQRVISGIRSLLEKI